MSRELVFYGERGILNSVILDMQGDISKQKQFLRSIVLADKSRLEWIDDICTVKYFVEPYFDDFGRPDLIIEVTTLNDEKYILFVDVKIDTYKNMALKMDQLENKNNEYLPASYNENCEKINVKLAILYRFIQACRYNLYEDNFTNNIISETGDISTSYNDNKVRKLENWMMIDYWNENYKNAKEYYFVVLTNDTKEIMEPRNLNSELFPFNNKSIMPPIGEENWQVDKNKFGLITYDTLIEKKVISKECGCFKDTSNLISLRTPSILDYRNKREPEYINYEKLTNNHNDLSNFISEIKNMDMDVKSFIKGLMETV